MSARTTQTGISRRHVTALLAALGTVVLVSGACLNGRAQSKREAAGWINTRGEELLKELTGNSSLQWELDGDGTLKITDRNPLAPGQAGLKEIYTYVNLYDLDSDRITTEEPDGETRRPMLVLTCRPEKEGCIKSRRHFGNGGSETRARSSISWSLRNEPDLVPAADSMEAHLARAIRLFRGTSSE